MDIQRDHGSFRDPSGYVFYYKDEVYRAIDEKAFLIISSLQKENTLKELVELGYVVGTEILTPQHKIYQELQALLPKEKWFLKHQKISMISYPYEWSIGMLADAALITLKLQSILIEKGYSLKDASVYNIQFVNDKPVFIDITSIEQPPRLDIWNAYGQFCQMFLYPAMLQKYKGLPIKNYYISNTNGMAIEDVHSIIGSYNSLKPSFFVDVFLQFKLQKTAQKQTGKLKSRVAQKNTNFKPQKLNLDRLISKISKLRKNTIVSGHWADYVNTHSYSDAAEKEKVDYINNFLHKYSPEKVIDIGCNTGQYSILAAKNKAKVIATDYDHSSIDKLYNEIKGKDLSILPLCVDITNPSPSIGFENKERKSFLERIDCDAIFALALIHHLVITSRIPLVKLRDFFYQTTSKYLVIEFVAREDSMFQKLLELREDIYESIVEDEFLKIFQEKFTILESSKIAGTQRTLFTLEKIVNEE
ncbi:class I SAM-dependent methyltransferase [Candidatus Uabimicrobium sp. HlEnr_7]|uniref:class I SAM-dependent methyltransferase n=1 Tax=Candidatus Uabimicrobium helgolandensis TaxID=3095367 RepID=UPI003557503C